MSFALILGPRILVGEKVESLGDNGAVGVPSPVKELIKSPNIAPNPPPAPASPELGGASGDEGGCPMKILKRSAIEQPNFPATTFIK